MFDIFQRKFVTFDVTKSIGKTDKVVFSNELKRDKYNPVSTKFLIHSISDILGEAINW